MTSRTFSLVSHTSALRRLDPQSFLYSSRPQLRNVQGMVIIMVDGLTVLGLVIGTTSACDRYMENEIEKTATLTEKLSKIA